MSYPLENALFQWEEGTRALQAIEDPRARRLADRVVDAIREELRRRIGPTFTAAELADLYGAGTDWCLQLAIDDRPGGRRRRAGARRRRLLALPAEAPTDFAGGRQLAGLSYSSESSDSSSPSPLPAAPARRMTIWSASMRTVTSRLPAQCSA